MNKFKGRLALYLTVGLLIPILIYLIYSSTEGFWFTLGVLIIAIVVEVVYKIQGKS